MKTLIVFENGVESLETLCVDGDYKHLHDTYLGLLEPEDETEAAAYKAKCDELEKLVYEIIKDDYEDEYMMVKESLRVDIEELRRLVKLPETELIFCGMVD